jgi:hypothetical protein
MDIGTLVAWVQAAIWAVVVIGFLYKVIWGGQAMPNWAFSTRILIPVIALGVIASGFSLYWNYRNLPLKPDEWKNYRKDAIVGQTFTQERVIVDGHSYSSCTFDRVTLVYNGTAPFDLVNNTFIAPIQIKSDNPVVMNTFSAAKEFERLNREMNADVNGKIKPPDQK